MRKYHMNASSTARFAYGVELHAGLSRFSETTGAAAEILSVNDALYAQTQKRVALLVPMIKARASLRFGEYHVDGVIRSAFRAAQVADGGRSGRICAVMFPNGLREVTKPAGKNQVKPTKELIERLAHSMTAGIEEYRAVWLPKLEAALSQLEASIAAYEAAQAAHHDAFMAERALRDAHHDKVDQVMGIVRATFPRDRDTQDVIFPIMTTARESEDEPEVISQPT